LNAQKPDLELLEAMSGKIPLQFRQAQRSTQAFQRMQCAT
jgi:hypothetical protein